MSKDDSAKMDRNEYIEERRLLVNLEAESYKSFDTALLTFSSGAIALSITFLEKFAGTIHISLLILSWVLWVASILFQLVSYLISAKAMREELAILNHQYNHYDRGAKINKWTGWPTKFNLFALASFLSAVIFFLVFVTINLCSIIG